MVYRDAKSSALYALTLRQLIVQDFFRVESVDHVEEKY